MPLKPIQKLRLQTIRRATVISAVAGAVLGIFFYFNYKIDFLPILFRSAMIGAMIGLTLSSIEEFLIGRRLERKPFFVLFLVRAIPYTIVCGFWLAVANSYFFQQEEGPDASFFEVFKTYILYGTFQNDIFWTLGICVLVVTFIQISNLHGKGVLWKYITGRYHKPTEVEHIFLFVDLRSSTTLAEKLGNKQFSSFLRDLFYDVSEGIVLSKGQVYSYVGDGLIVTWPWKDGIKNANCARCLFYIQNTLKQLESTYLERYGHAPKLKAGLHGGKAIVTWVGEIKREIVFHGDVLNTTSRLEGECNRLEQSLLISEELLNHLSLPANIKATYQDEITLRGKQRAIKIFSLEQMLQLN